MSSPTVVEAFAPPSTERPRRPRWTIGRVATDLAMVLIAVPLAVDALSGPAPRGCGMTPEANALALGLAILAVRGGRIGLKSLNDAGERWLGLPDAPVARRKPEPPDDL